MARSLPLAVVAVLLALATPALAFQTYQARIPNGASVMRNGVAWPGVGHLRSSGGGARNLFGMAFAAANRSWTTALCQADSDGDGFSNGMELGDPNCVWTVGATPARTTGISHPGFVDSVPASAASTPCAATSTNVYRASACAGYTMCATELCTCAGTTGTSDTCLMSATSLNCSTFNMCAHRFMMCLNRLAMGARANTSDPCNTWAVALHTQLLTAAVGNFSGSGAEAACAARVCEMKNRTSLSGCGSGINASLACMPPMNASGRPNMTGAPTARYAVRAQLRLGGNWTALFNNPAARTQLMTALANDLGRYLGINPSFITILNIALGSLVVDFAVAEGSGANVSSLESKIGAAASNSSWLSEVATVASNNGGPATITVTSSGVTTTTTAGGSSTGSLTSATGTTTSSTTATTSSAARASAALVAAVALVALVC